MSRSSITTKKRGPAAPRRVTTHPGEVLSEEFLNPLGMSANALAAGHPHRRHRQG
jgi:plasmid maintenance system antidote protein VapI